MRDGIGRKYVGKIRRARCENHDRKRRIKSTEANLNAHPFAGLGFVDLFFGSGVRCNDRSSLATPSGASKVVIGVSIVRFIVRRGGLVGLGNFLALGWRRRSLGRGRGRLSLNNGRSINSGRSGGCVRHGAVEKTVPTSRDSAAGSCLRPPPSISAADIEKSEKLVLSLLCCEAMSRLLVPVARMVRHHGQTSARVATRFNGP